MSKLHVKTLVVLERSERDRRRVYLGNEEVSKRMCGRPVRLAQKTLREVAGQDKLCN